MVKSLVIPLNNIEENIPVSRLKYSANNHKVYHCAQHIFFKVSQKERSLYDYLCEQMDPKNQVTITNSMVNHYIHFIHEITNQNIKLSSATVHNSISKLNDIGLLIKGPGNSGFYFVNPKYASKVSESKRKDVIQRIVNTQKKHNLSFAAILNFTLKITSEGKKQ